MTAQQKLILIEFNELCPPLLTRWMAEGRLPNFKALHGSSEVFVTESDAEPPALEPWIQWYSLHTGLPYRDHGVFHLTEGPAQDHADIWSMLAGAGHRVMNFSSMNARAFDYEGSFCLPDPWCEAGEAHPPEVKAFHDFVVAQVQEYSNPQAAGRLAQTARFLWFMARRGLSPETVGRTLAQLWAEKTDDPRLTYRRAFILDAFATDVFRWYWTKLKPDFATIFLNSTAHTQHSYWRYMEPELFSMDLAEQETAFYGGAIREAYEKMDGVLGRLRRLAEAHGVRLAFATGLSQQPYLDGEGAGGRRYHRPHDVGTFLKALGISPKSIDPVMTHQYILRFEAPQAREAARQALATKCWLGDEPVLQVYDADGGDALIFDVELRRLIDPQTPFTMEGHGTTFGEWFYTIDQAKSGKHHPDGCFWIQSAAPRIVSQKVSVLDVLPTLLAHFGLERPETLPHGRSLLNAA